MAFGIAAAALAVAAYANALHNPFVYDDRSTVLANPSLVDLTNVRFILVYSLFRPVVNVSYAIDRAIWGFAPFGFHLTSVALHALVVVLFYAWVGRALRDDAERSGSAATGWVWTAFLASALYAVHPLMTEAAGYVSGRSEVLCAAGVLASLLLARRAVVEDSKTAAWLAVACGLLAAASKESAAVLPILLLAYDAWVLSPALDDADGWKRRARRAYLPAMVVIAIGGAVRLSTLVSAEAHQGYGPLQYLLTQGFVIWQYLALLVVPSTQTIMHAVPPVMNVASPLAWFALLTVAAVPAVAIAYRRRAPLLAVAAVWLFAALAPSSSIIPLRETMAEHRVYLASGGFFLAVAVALRAAAGAGVAIVVRAIAAAVVAGLFVQTVQRNRVWADPVALWAEAASRAPDMWEPHFALADTLRDADQCDRAVPEYETVLRLRPNHRDAVTNMGICLAQLGRPEDAEQAFLRAVAIDPAWPRGYTNLGALAIVTHDPERARDYYLQALEHDPRNVLARMQLAALYEHAFHDYHSAARMCGEARAIAPFTPGVAECAERNARLAAEHDAGR